MWVIPAAGLERPFEGFRDDFFGLATIPRPICQEAEKGLGMVLEEPLEFGVTHGISGFFGEFQKVDQKSARSFV